MTDENLIKQTCKELNLTYKELAEIIRNSEATIHLATTKG